MRIIFFLLLLNFQLSIAQEINEFVPKNWKVILKTTGDLNKDTFEDVAIVIEENNTNNYKLNEGLGADTLNMNPRDLIILFGNANGKFKLQERNKNKFIPSENDQEIPCLQDPLDEANGIEIKNGLLFINFYYWLSCGSWYVNTAKFTFRFQNNEFILIGFDNNSMHRSLGNEESVSMNFITQKKIITTGGNVFEEEKNNPKVKKSKIKNSKLIKLRDCNNLTYSELQN